jgi:dolichol-phosphate mannosyltransferase
MTERDTLIVVPTYNEAENIDRLIGEIEQLAPDVDILVVDDNSPDGTGGLVARWQLKSPRVHLLKRSGKEGLAAAYTAGFQWGLQRAYRKLIQMDADFSHHPKYLPAFVDNLRTYPVVTGSRYIAGGGTSGWGWTRNAISRGGNTYARWVLGLHHHDLTGGFNGWRREVLERIRIDTIRSRGYAFQVEMKYRAARLGFTLKEIPIHFENRRLGTSKMSGDIVWEAAFRVFQMKNRAFT